MGSLVWMTINLLLLNTVFEQLVVGEENGVYVTFMGAKVANDGYVPFHQVNISYWSVMCHTNKSDCCKSPKLGNWFYPNGSTVLGFTQFQNTYNTSFYAQPFFARNRGQQVVRLYRTHNSFVNPRLTGSERGRYHCVVPNDQDSNQTVFINILDIGEVVVTLSPSTGTLGESSFSLVCSVNITTDPFPDNVPSPFFTWLFTSNDTSLKFPLPTGVVENTSNIRNTYTSTLKFSPLLVSHAGTYICQLGGNERLTASTTVTVNVPICTYLMSDPVDPITPGTNVTLTCIVEMSPSVREFDLALLMVDAQLSTPNGTLLSLTTMGQEGRTFNYTVSLGSFIPGNYSCTASLSSQSLPYVTLSGRVSDTIRVTYTESNQVLNENASNDVAIIGGVAGAFSLLLVIAIAIPIIIVLLRHRRVGNVKKVFTPSHPVTFSETCKHKEIIETVEIVQGTGTMEYVEMDTNQAYMTCREAHQQQGTGTVEYLEVDTNQAYITNSVPTEPNVAYGTHPPEVHDYEHVALPSETQSRNF